MEELREVQAQLQETGYAFLPKWKPELSTVEALDVIQPSLCYGSRKHSEDRCTDLLRPRRACDSKPNQYSGIFGLDEFPLHSDLSHWAVPPRYFVLRCLIGASSVVTRVLPANSAAMAVARRALRRAVFRPRKGTAVSSACLLPGSFRSNDIEGFRWDPVFLLPINSHAQSLTSVLSPQSVQVELVGVPLCEQGDTLVIDNWRVLHGRSSVDPLLQSERVIERAYFEALKP
jgi:L-asparagine oxygenase